MLCQFHKNHFEEPKACLNVQDAVFHSVGNFRTVAIKDTGRIQNLTLAVGVLENGGVFCLGGGVVLNTDFGGVKHSPRQLDA